MMQFCRLNDETQIYRTLTGSMVASNIITPNAFLRKNPHEGRLRDINGLSVALMNERREDKVIQDLISGMPSAKAICSMTVGDVRSVSIDNPATLIDVVQDSIDHANIVGLPDMHDHPATTAEGQQKRNVAERLAGELARRASLCWSKPAK